MVNTKHIEIRSFQIWLTYEGVLEGNPKCINAEIFRKIEDIAHKGAGANSIKIVNTVQLKNVNMEDRNWRQNWKYPQYTCMACFSGPIIEEKIDPNDESADYLTDSRLKVIWQTDSLDGSLHEIVMEGLKNINWIEHAVNWGI